jgi:hypothetical protein
MLVVGERHLTAVLTGHTRCYNDHRPRRRSDSSRQVRRRTSLTSTPPGLTGDRSSGP